MEELIKAFEGKPVKWVKDRNYIVSPLFDHEPETPYLLLKSAVEELSKITDFSKADKILGEEDRGGFLASLLAYEHKKSLAMVKWFPIDLKIQVPVDFRNAYTEGKMYLYGVRKGDNLILVEDIVDSGGTIIAMIKLLREVGANIIDVVAIAEKEEFLGIERIKKETGVDVKCLLKFSTSGSLSKVTSVSSND
jgi:adenine phosphoribosyltransferase